MKLALKIAKIGLPMAASSLRAFAGTSTTNEARKARELADQLEAVLAAIQAFEALR